MCFCPIWLHLVLCTCMHVPLDHPEVFCLSTDFCMGERYSEGICMLKTELWKVKWVPLHLNNLEAPKTIQNSSLPLWYIGFAKTFIRANCSAFIYFLTRENTHLAACFQLACHSACKMWRPDQVTIHKCPPTGWDAKNDLIILLLPIRFHTHKEL